MEVDETKESTTAATTTTAATPTPTPTATMTSAQETPKPTIPAENEETTTPTQRGRSNSPKKTTPMPIPQQQKQQRQDLTEKRKPETPVQHLADPSSQLTNASAQTQPPQGKLPPSNTSSLPSLQSPRPASDTLPSVPALATPNLPSPRKIASKISPSPPKLTDSRPLQKLPTDRIVPSPERSLSKDAIAPGPATTWPLAHPGEHPIPGVPFHAGPMDHQRFPPTAYPLQPFSQAPFPMHAPPLHMTPYPPPYPLQLKAYGAPMDVDMEARPKEFKFPATGKKPSKIISRVAGSPRSTKPEGNASKPTQKSTPKPAPTAKRSEERKPKKPIEVRNHPSLAMEGMPQRNLGYYIYSPGQLLPSCADKENGVFEVRIPSIYLTYDNPMVKKRAAWGTDVYTDDSDIVAMIIHSGIYSPPLTSEQNTSSDTLPSATPEHDVKVAVRVLPKLLRYGSSMRYRIRSRSWGDHDGVSFKIEKVTKVPLGSAYRDGFKNRKRVLDEYNEARKRVMAGVRANNIFQSYTPGSLMKDGTLLFNKDCDPCWLYKRSLMSDEALLPIKASTRLATHVLYLENDLERYELSLVPSNGGTTSQRYRFAAVHRHIRLTPDRRNGPTDVTMKESSSPSSTSNEEGIDRVSLESTKTTVSGGLPIPLPESALSQILAREIRWEDIQWGNTGVIVDQKGTSDPSGLFVPITGFYWRSLAATPIDAPTTTATTEAKKEDALNAIEILPPSSSTLPSASSNVAKVALDASPGSSIAPSVASTTSSLPLSASTSRIPGPSVNIKSTVPETTTR